MRESAVLFGAADSLVGIVTEPEPGTARTDAPAVLILNSGLVHRVGPKRMHVRLARRLAAQGFLTMRIDFSGIGDSRPADSTTPIPERWINEALDAMRYLRRNHGATHFITAGNCSGAALAFLIARAEPDVTAAALINPQGPPSLRYYLRLAFSQPAFWRRLGRLELLRDRLQEARQLAARAAAESNQPAWDTQRILQEIRALIERNVRLLIVNCEWDAGYDLYQFKLRDRLLAMGGNSHIRLEKIPGSDHDFNLVSSQERLLDIVQDWAASL